MIQKSFKDIEIFQLSYILAMKIHDISLKLPKFELYEEGNQIRRSSKSVATNIIEGFGRRMYKNEFVKFLTYAYGSCQETKVHLNFIFDSGYIKKITFEKYYEEYEDLGVKIYKFIKTIKLS